MERETNVRGVGLGETLATALGECSGVTYVIDPWVGFLEAVAAAGREHDADLPTVRVLARPGTLRTARKDFTVGSKLADVVESGDVSLRSREELSESTLFTDGDRLFSPVAVGDHVGALRETEASFVDGVYETLDGQWTGAEPFDLRTPGRTTIRETMTDEFGTTAREDFETVVDAIEGGRSSRELDEVIVSLLVAAKNELLLYDVSKWGEDLGLASKATFSRRKNDLEEMEVLETEKSPTDVGRPRQRLTLADDRLRDADADQLAVVAQNVLH